MKELSQAQMHQVNGAGPGNLLVVFSIGIPVGGYVGLMAAGYTLSSMCVMTNNTLEYCGEILNNTFISVGENATNIGVGVVLSWGAMGALIGVAATAGVVLAAN